MRRAGRRKSSRNLGNCLFFTLIGIYTLIYFYSRTIKGKFPRRSAKQIGNSAVPLHHQIRDFDDLTTFSRVDNSQLEEDGKSQEIQVHDAVISKHLSQKLKFPENSSDEYSSKNSTNNGTITSVSDHPSVFTNKSSLEITNDKESFNISITKQRIEEKRDSTSRKHSIFDKNLKDSSEASREIPPHIEQDFYGRPELFDGRKEVFECDRSHWRSDICTMKGDIRVDPGQYLAVLYTKELGTKRGFELLKPYTRKWEKEAMKTVTDIILLSVESPPNLENLPSFPKRNLSKFHDNVVKLQKLRKKKFECFENCSVSQNSTWFHFWSENNWRQKKAEILSPEETQLGMLNFEAFQNGMNLVERGGTIVQEDKYRWVEFKERKLTSPQNLTQFPPLLKCQIRHKVPGIIFSTSGYTGNTFHEFTDGLIPLFATSAHMGGEFVMLIERPVLWWFIKYENLLRQLSNYPVVLLGKEERVHCFPHLIVGLRFHEDLSIFPKMMPDGSTSILDFQKKLEAAWDVSEYFPAPKYPQIIPKKAKILPICLPLLSILSRDGSRSITNEVELFQLAKKLGFRVQVLSLAHTVPLPWVWGKLRGKLKGRGKKSWWWGMKPGPSSGGLTLGVHGAALTNFLFLRKGDYFLQIVPLGLSWPSRFYIGNPAKRMGLHYTEYLIAKEESTLSKEYPENHPILFNPEGKLEKSWNKWRNVYLENQNVTLDLTRMRNVLMKIKGEIENDPNYLAELENKRSLKECT